MSEVVIVIGDEELEYKLKSASPDRLAKDIVADTADHLVSYAKVLAPQRTGNLFRAIDKDGPNEVGAGVYAAYVSVGKIAPYAKFVEYGTGIFGKKASLIRPRTGNLLVWKEHGGNVFARHTKGQKAQHYMRDAYIVTKDEYLPSRVAMESKKLSK